MKAALTALYVGTMFAIAAPAAHAQTPAGFEWSGFYVGAHAGWQWNDLHYYEPDDPSFAFDPDFDGFTGGGLLGYNHRIDRFVTGVEVDGGIVGGSFGPGSGNGYSSFEPLWNARLRARLGYTFGNTLVFGAAGLAALRMSLDDVDAGFGSDDATHVGWTVGGGAEHAIGDHLIVRFEYLYDDYGSQDYWITAPPGPFSPGYQGDIDLSAHTLRAALSYRF